MERGQSRPGRKSDARRRTFSSKSKCQQPHRVDAPSHPMTPRLRTHTLALLAAVPIATANADEIEELKAMVRAMQKTITQQNDRIANLEKRQASAKEKTTTKTKSDRSITVAGSN